MLAFERVAIIGVGLIGSSIARAVQQKMPTVRIFAHDRDPAVRARVEELGIADDVADSAAAAVTDADLVILCVPPGAMGEVVREIAEELADGAVVSDVGSVKSSVIAAVSPALPPRVHFIPAHPIAGTEHSGPDAGMAGLFENRWTIVTPAPDADPLAVERLRSFWSALGANVDLMDPEHHDLVLAVTSHVPHLIAYTIVGTADDLQSVTRSEVIKYSAGGFRDFTRVAASDPTMWRDVFLMNKDAVLEMLQRFTEDLTALQRAIRWGDGDTLHALFTRTRSIRRTIIDAGQDTPAADFGRRASQGESS
jgi:cyclohexadieny/prephenate dehydrogenase